MSLQQNKYHNRKIIVDNIEFASKREARRYCELSLLEKAGAITSLQTQVKYVLIPAQREADIVGKRGGVKPGKLIERECAYIADFVYFENGKWVVEDTKGYRTKEYKIKKKLMLYVHGIRIKEV